MSPNAQVVHGINTPLKSGDVIFVDCGKQNGYHGDHAYSFEIWRSRSCNQKLLQITESLYVGIREFKAEIV
jgi:methionyl aminopeptidase